MGGKGPQLKPFFPYFFRIYQRDRITKEQIELITADKQMRFGSQSCYGTRSILSAAAAATWNYFNGACVGLIFDRERRIMELPEGKCALQTFHCLCLPMRYTNHRIICEPMKPKIPFSLINSNRECVSLCHAQKMQMQIYIYM